jgi:hypothetical protein
MGKDSEQRHHEPDQIALDLDLAATVTVAESNLRVAQQPDQRAAVRDPHLFDLLSGIGPNALAGPEEFELDRGVPETAQKPQQQARLDRLGRDATLVARPPWRCPSLESNLCVSGSGPDSVLMFTLTPFVPDEQADYPYGA